jgi:heptosyltransferase-2
LRKSIVRVPNWIGDAVVSLSFLEVLKNSLKIEPPVILVKSYVAPLFKHMERIITFNTRRELFLKSFNLRREKFEMGFVLPHSFSSALSLFLTGSENRIGYGTEKRSLLLTHPVKLPANWRKEHLLKNFLRLLEVYGIRTDKLIPPLLPLEGREIDKTLSLLKKLGLKPKGFIAYAPFTAYGSAKEWGIEKFRELMLRMVKEGFPGVVMGGNEDKERSHFFNDLDGIFNLTGKLSLRETASLLSLSVALVSNDSGLSHLSSAVGTPVIVIFGSTSPVWSRPLGEDNRIIYKADSLSCSPCFKRECPLSHKKCMEIDVEDVVEGIFNLLNH